MIDEKIGEDVRCLDEVLDAKGNRALLMLFAFSNK
jgi:hypothetical protein